MADVESTLVLVASDLLSNDEETELKNLFMKFDGDSNGKIWDFKKLALRNAHQVLIEWLYKWAFERLRQLVPKCGMLWLN